MEVVSIVPRESSHSGVIRYGTDDDREATGLHTKRRLRQLIVHALAPHAAEEIVLGKEELSVFNEEGLVRARDLANRLVFLGGFGEFSPAVGRRALAFEQEGSSFLNEASVFTVPPFVSDRTYDAADAQVARVLAEGLDEAKRLLARGPLFDLTSSSPARRCARRADGAACCDETTLHVQLLSESSRVDSTPVERARGRRALCRAGSCLSRARPEPPLRLPSLTVGGPLPRPGCLFANRQTEHREELTKLTDTLLSKHSLTGAEVAAVLVRQQPAARGGQGSLLSLRGHRVTNERLSAPSCRVHRGLS